MTKLTRTIWDRLETADNKLRSNPKQGIEFLLAQRPLLSQQTIAAEGRDSLAMWARYYQKLFCYSEHLPSREAALEFAREALERFRVDKATLYDRDFVPVRFALRMAHAMLAEDALDAGRVAEASFHIDACFEVKSSSGEYEDPFAPYEVLRARILLATGTAGAARTNFFDALLRVENKAKREYVVRQMLDAAPAEFRTWFGHPDYAAYKAEHSVEKLRRGSADEKWPAAVARVERAIAVLWPADSDADVSCRETVIRSAPETPGTLAACEARIGWAIPAPLRTLYLEHGAFALRDPDYWRSLRLRDSGSSLRMLAGLQEAIDELWGGRPEFAASFDAAQIERLNREFVVFGDFFHDSNAYTHLYFTRGGGFGTLYYDQDDWDSARESLEQMLADPEAETRTLDALISEFASDVIDALIEQRDEADSQA
ncbi:MAG: SMI1/KNR4 family protein [Sterolibacteriaceae bacterium]|nr:SMI1/KNR4 family protein [Candidatus Methylophosphatis haderslevensis]